MRRVYYLEIYGPLWRYRQTKRTNHRHADHSMGHRFSRLEIEGSEEDQCLGATKCL